MPPVPIRTAVVGAGYFGRFHAAKYAAAPAAQLVAVADIDAARGAAVAAEFGCDAATDYRAVIDRVDAVSIAAPASTHFAIARDFLAAGKHVLVEKPIALRLEDADRLIALAQGAGVVLQVGHQERFLFDRLDPAALAPGPTEIVCRRAGPFSGRGIDTNVVLDLMIHDLDLVHRLVIADPQAAAAAGKRVRTAHVDAAEVSLKLGENCTAHLFASRVSDRRERWIRVSGPSGAFELDFVAQRLTRGPADGNGHAKDRGANGADTSGLFGQDLLQLEIADFLDAVRIGRRPRVTGEDGRRALATALMINRSLAQQIAVPA